MAMEKAMTAIEKVPAESSSGWKIEITEDFKSSKPIKRIKKLIKRPEMYSRRPCPKGWFLSGSFEASLNPNNWIIELAESERLLNASAVIATLFAIVPAINLEANRKRFKMIPRMAHKTP